MRGAWLCSVGCFDHPPEGREVDECLIQLRQDGQTAAEYAPFRTVAESSGWNEPAFHTLFRRVDCAKSSRWSWNAETTPSPWTHCLMD